MKEIYTPCQLHGIRLKDCPICLKRTGECDFGACEEKAQTDLAVVSRGKVQEIRGFCERHAQFTAQTFGYLRIA